MGSNPIVMPISAYKKVIEQKHKGKFDPRLIYQLEEKMKNPIMTYSLNGEIGVLIEDDSGKYVLVGINSNKKTDRGPANSIRSMYTLDNP